MIIAVASGSGSRCVAEERACASTATDGREMSSREEPSQICAPESFRMCARSLGPESGGTGTAGTPAMRHPVTAMTVSILAVASTATLEAPAISFATADAAAMSSDRVRALSPTRTASGPSAPWPES